MNCLFNWQANECFSITNRPLLHPHLLFHIEKNIIFIQYNDYIEYFYYLCDVEKEEPAGPNHIPVKSGEEWVKSEQKLFTTPNALFIGIYKGKVKSEEFLALRRNKKYKE